MNRRNFIFLCFISFFAFIITYTTINTISHLSSKSSKEKTLFMGGHEIDPVIRMPARLRSQRKGKRLFHTALTANDAAYNRWQSRIMYYWFKKFKDLPGSEMGGFTRILHSGKPDNFMDEIPTFVVDPLPDGLDRVSSLILTFIFDLVWSIHVSSYM